MAFRRVPFGHVTLSRHSVTFFMAFRRVSFDHVNLSRHSITFFIHSFNRSFIFTVFVTSINFAVVSILQVVPVLFGC